MAATVLPSSAFARQTLVLTRRKGKWRIAEFQNTLDKPEHPFPVAPESVLNRAAP